MIHLFFWLENDLGDPTLLWLEDGPTRRNSLAWYIFKGDTIFYHLGVVPGEFDMQQIRGHAEELAEIFEPADQELYYPN